MRGGGQGFPSGLREAVDEGKSGVDGNDVVSMGVDELGLLHCQPQLLKLHGHRLGKSTSLSVTSSEGIQPQLGRVEWTQSREAKEKMTITARNQDGWARRADKFKGMRFVGTETLKNIIY